jgi:hypothetical protein
MPASGKRPAAAGVRLACVLQVSIKLYLAVIVQVIIRVELTGAGLPSFSITGI